MSPLASDRAEREGDMRHHSLSIVEPRVGGAYCANACVGGSRFIERALKRGRVVPQYGACADDGDRDGTEPAGDQRVVGTTILVNIEGGERDAGA